jgi:hypothetical protein
MSNMKWLRQGSKEEDDLRIEVADTLIDTTCNADDVNRIEMATGRNLRDQLTVEKAEDLDRERRLLRMGNNRN